MKNEAFICRLPAGMDLLEALNAEFKKRNIQKAFFTVIGAVTSATIAFYDLAKRKYKVKEFVGNYEILQCSGNVSLKDADTFVHAHIVIADSDFRCFGGHLMSKTPILAAELSAVPLSGTLLSREYDEQTGLYLWPMQY